MTYTELDSAFKQITGDTNATFFTAAMKLAWANEAIAEAARRSGCIEKRQTIISVASQAEYTLPTDVATVLRVAYDGVALQHTTQGNLSRESKEWTTLTGTPFQFYMDMVNGKIGLYYKPALATTAEIVTDGYGVYIPGDAPDGYGAWVDTSDAGVVVDGEGAPLASASGNDIEVFYVADATAIAAPDTPGLPPWSHGLILFWMLARAYEAETMLQNVAASQLYLHLAEKIIGRLATRSRGKLRKTWQQQATAFIETDLAIEDRFSQYATET